jgi:hypothetical protein
VSRALRHACCARQAAPVNKGWASSQQCCPFRRRLKLAQLPQHSHAAGKTLPRLRIRHTSRQGRCVWTGLAESVVCEEAGSWGTHVLCVPCAEPKARSLPSRGKAREQKEKKAAVTLP